ncbi:MAG TPA: glutamine amidotransferase [Candidatus Nanopelagicaceae bacterium]|nr:glutamine amidotransferase [Candidatus Nanopelagicaceae bacterium]
MSGRRLVLGLLYPREMNLYGDRGNVLALTRRAERRGLRLDVVTIGLEAQASSLIPACSGFLIGGGQDLDQVMVAEDLVRSKGPALRTAISQGAPLLAVCAGFQLLGSHYLTQDGTAIPGLGLLPMHTVASSERLVGNLLLEADPGLGLRRPLLVGFENHSGRTELAPGLAPLGKVVRGRGNTGQSGFEGAWSGSVLGTYLHGPLLPKNPQLADWWLGAALSRAGEDPELPELDDSLEETARVEAIARTMHPDRAPRLRLLGRGLGPKGAG